MKLSATAGNMPIITDKTTNLTMLQPLSQAARLPMRKPSDESYIHLPAPLPWANSVDTTSPGPGARLYHIDQHQKWSVLALTNLALPDVTLPGLVLGDVTSTAATWDRFWPVSPLCGHSLSGGEVVASVLELLMAVMPLGG